VIIVEVWGLIFGNFLVTVPRSWKSLASEPMCAADCKTIICFWSMRVRITRFTQRTIHVFRVYKILGFRSFFRL